MTLNEQFATPQAYIDHLNAQQPEGSTFKLVYSDYMGETAQDVADYLDMASFSDWYKDVNGFRPRGFTLEQARDWMERERANPTPLDEDDDFDVPAHVLADEETIDFRPFNTAVMAELRDRLPRG